MMMEEEIYREAIRQWGTKAQLLMWLEESSELNHAICAYLRGREGAKEGVIEEMADCQIMLNQLKIVFEGDGFARLKTQKLLRLQERLHMSSSMSLKPSKSGSADSVNLQKEYKKT